MPIATRVTIVAIKTIAAIKTSAAATPKLKLTPMTSSDPESNTPASEQQTEAESGTEGFSKPSAFAVISSVLAAGFGVQSSKNRERDFKHGKASTFFIAGVIFTVLFVLTLYSVVTMVISNAR